MNYRHHFHAGNFADVFKHGVLLAIVAAMKREPISLRVVETHAGAGVYDLRGEEAHKSKEAETGIMRLMADAEAPDVFDPLKKAVAAENAGGEVDIYPGSPVQLSTVLDEGDAYLSCELRPDDQDVLARILSRRAAKAQVVAQLADGYTFAVELPAWRGQTLVVIDPPFERGDEYDQIVSAALVSIRRHNAMAIWTPIKDLETLDALVSRLESLNPANILVAEVRLRPLTDPMKMNGCAMILINAPDIEAEVAVMAHWVAAHCGEAGGTARVTAA